MARSAFAASVLALILVGSVAARADTPVSGYVSGTWTLGGSPYEVVGNIQAGNLTIEPGVAVEFIGSFNFVVSGRLTAVGTREDSIRFVRGADGPGWGGVFFDHSGPSHLSYCVIEGATNSGVHVAHSYPVIDHCAIRGNVSATASGGGLLVESDSALTIRNCPIVGNQCGAGSVSYGGGVCALTTGKLTLDSCTVEANVSLASTTGNAASYGGGLYAESTLVLKGCVVRGNQATTLSVGSWWSSCAYGGGAYVGMSLVAINTGFVDNRGYTYSYPGGQAMGGGIYVGFGPSLQLWNCALGCNELTSYAVDGSAILTLTEATTIVNCSVGYDEGGAALSAPYLNPVSVRNSIFYFHEGGSFAGTDPTVDYSDIEGGHAGTGNIDWNPIFAGPCAPYILPDSPCVDAGDPAPAYNDACFAPDGPSRGTARNDMGAFGGPLACTMHSLGVGDAAPIAGDRLLRRLVPNPSRGSLSLDLQLPQPGHVRISVVDVQGREVARLADRHFEAGAASLRWEPRGGEPLSSGVYFVTVRALGREEVERIAILR